MPEIRCKSFCQSVKGGVFNIGQLSVRPIIHFVTSYGRINLHSRGNYRSKVIGILRRLISFLREESIALKAVNPKNRRP